MVVKTLIAYSDDVPKGMSLTYKDKTMIRVFKHIGTSIEGNYIKPSPNVKRIIQKPETLVIKGASVLESCKEERGYVVLTCSV